MGPMFQSLGRNTALLDSPLEVTYNPKPSSYPLLGPKYPLLGTIHPQLRVQGRSRQFSFNYEPFLRQLLTNPMQAFSKGQESSREVHANTQKARFGQPILQDLGPKALLFESLDPKP